MKPDDAEEPITSKEYREVVARLQRKGFGDTPIEEALLDAIKRIAQKVEQREAMRRNGNEA